MRIPSLARHAVVLLLGSAPMLVARGAHANGRFPAANQLVVAPSDPNTLLARTTFGLLVTHDRGDHWDWICEAAVGFVGNTDPSVALTKSGSALLGKFDALEVASGDGCDWRAVGGALAGAYVADLVVRPEAPSTAFAITSTYVSNDGGIEDAGAQYDARVFGTTDDGATWTQVGTPLPSSWVLETIEVAASDPNRLYVSAVRGTLDARQAALFVSIDRGATWSERPIPILQGTVEPSVFIGAVDPSNPDVVYLRTGGLSDPSKPSRLLVTKDAGKTFSAPLTLKGQMLGFALSPDGKTVWAGGFDDGLLRAKTTDLAFTSISTLRTRCLRATDSELWACSDEPSGFTLGRSTDDGVTFAAKLHIDGIRGPIACKQKDASAAICPNYWPAQCEALGGCGPTTDGGTTDAGKPVTVPQTSGSSGSSCGCEVGPNSAAGAGVALMAATALASAARRRRRC